MRVYVFPGQKCGRGYLEKHPVHSRNVAQQGEKRQTSSSKLQSLELFPLHLARICPRLVSSAASDIPPFSSLRALPIT